MNTAFFYCGVLTVGSMLLCVVTQFLQSFFDENYCSETEFVLDTPLKFAIAVWIFSALASSIAFFGGLGFMGNFLPIITNIGFSVFIVFKILKNFETILK